MSGQPIECRSEEGITEGLVDSIIFMCRVLAKRDLTPENVQGALADLLQDKDFHMVKNAQGPEVTEEDVCRILRYEELCAVFRSDLARTDPAEREQTLNNWFHSARIASTAYAYGRSATSDTGTE